MFLLSLKKEFLLIKVYSKYIKYTYKKINIICEIVLFWFTNLLNSILQIVPKTNINIMNAVCDFNDNKNNDA